MTSSLHASLYVTLRMRTSEYKFIKEILQGVTTKVNIEVRVGGMGDALEICRTLSRVSGVK